MRDSVLLGGVQHLPTTPHPRAGYRTTVLQVTPLRGGVTERTTLGMSGRLLTLSHRTVQSGFKVTPVCGASHARESRA